MCWGACRHVFCLRGVSDGRKVASGKGCRWRYLVERLTQVRSLMGVSSRECRILLCSPSLMLAGCPQSGQIHKFLNTFHSIMLQGTVCVDAAVGVQAREPLCI